eukprot:scpid21812/ scgid6344/ 
MELHCNALARHHALSASHRVNQHQHTASYSYQGVLGTTLDRRIVTYLFRLAASLRHSSRLLISSLSAGDLAAGFVQAGQLPVRSSSCDLAQSVVSDTMVDTMVV